MALHHVFSAQAAQCLPTPSPSVSYHPDSAHLFVATNRNIHNKGHKTHRVAVDHASRRNHVPSSRRLPVQPPNRSDFRVRAPAKEKDDSGRGRVSW